MKFNRIMAALLSVLMLLSAFTAVISADEASAETEIEYEYNTTNTKPTLDYFTGKEIKSNKVGDKVIYTKEDKLEYMDLRYDADGYQLYVDEYSGEVAVVDKATGEALFTNPYTIGDSKATAKVKEELMSQLIVKFLDVTDNNSSKTFLSYVEAAQRNQIVVRNIKSGIRVEYTLGREESKRLVPRMIEKSAFEEKIKTPIEENTAGMEETERLFLLTKLNSFYTLMDPNAVGESAKEEMYRNYEITKKMAVYVLKKDIADTQLALLEGYIKAYAPDYSFEDLTEDHALVKYESEDKNPPLFKMALEYTIDEQGLSVRLPANGIRFNEALYQLESIEILPYMGAGAKSNTAGNFSVNNWGYTFFPDGSGTLFEFNKIADLGSSTTVTGKVYGQDYAYHTISGTHQEIIRYPVFGLVETEDLTALQKPAEEGEGVAPASEELGTEPEKTTDTRGFLAIVEEGDALMELSSYHAVRTSEYNSVKITVYPRPKDTYNVADAISVGSNNTWTVVSSRKYTGNYKIRYIMLTDNPAPEDTSGKKFYDCDYVGMAMAYREYLEKKGVLTRLTEKDVNKDIPLYIETFGALQTTERFLSIPIDVMTPLTTFEDITTMYKDLSAEGVGITNVNFILTGFTKGGITDPQVPYYLNWEGAVSEEMSYEELLKDAEGKYGVYPDFDFAYVKGDGMFDGLSLKKHAVKTIDNRYSSKREYSATKHTYISYYDLALSPAYFSNFYNKLTKAYNDNYGRGGIAVSTLGHALNSDFDEDEPYNREDSKKFTVEALEHMSNSFDSVLTSGGNAYTWKYVDHITDVALDSSRYSQSWASVPFLGMVLHGYVEFAGEPINMEGNIEYALLKAIENGSAIQFILSYRNTNNLKNYEELSKYYSVRYDIWFDDVVSLYRELNTALNGVQTDLIEEHDFIKGTRIPDNDELIKNAEDLIAANNKAEADYLKALDEMTTDNYRTSRREIYRIVDLINSEFKSGSDYSKAVDAYKQQLAIALDTGKSTEDRVNALAELEKAATKMLDIYTKLSAEYGYATGEYRNNVNADPTLDATIKQNVNAAIDGIDADIKALLESDYVATVIAEISGAYASVNEAGGNAVFAYTYAAPEYKSALGNPAEIVKATYELPEYETDTNKIVYERYSDGTAFVLNFNNYKVEVTVEHNGETHTYSIDAYGYVVLPKNK